MKLIRAIFVEFWKLLTSREIAPGVYYRGGYLYENMNKPTTPPPYKFKKSTDLNN